MSDDLDALLASLTDGSGDSPLTTDIASCGERFIQALSTAKSISDVEKVRLAALGRRGLVSRWLKGLGTMQSDRRIEVAPKVHAIRARIEAALAARRDHFEREAIAARLQAEQEDITLPLPDEGLRAGRMHPLSRTFTEVRGIFASLGFSLREGPDIESDRNNFGMLNFPDDHPAREAQDTFFLPDSEGESMLLRTQTSPVQVRTMLSEAPPIRIICPGRTYRRDDDQTHTPMFHQLEGLVVDQQSHMGHLKWVLEYFLRRFFGVESVRLRFRPSFFPFTEPSMEVDVGCERRGEELFIGTGDDWMEILGCGMVHPNVLRNCGLDPDVYQGFAWGVGLDRLAMLKYGIADLRAFFESDLHWLRHHGFRLFAP